MSDIKNKQENKWRNTARETAKTARKYRKLYERTQKSLRDQEDRTTYWRRLALKHFTAIMRLKKNKQ